jgi:hypothetical protein
MLGIPRIRRNGTVFKMGIHHFYLVEKKGIGGLMEISLVMIQRSLNYTPIETNETERVSRSYKNQYP